MGLYPEEDREFNRYTLLGEWDDLYVALLRQRLVQDGLSTEHIEDQFRAHLHRGVIALSKLAKGLPDLIRLSQRGFVSNPGSNCEHVFRIQPHLRPLKLAREWTKRYEQLQACSLNVTGPRSAEKTYLCL